VPHPAAREAQSATLKQPAAAHEAQVLEKQPVGGSPVELVDANVFVQLDGGDSVDDALWHLDTGATIHMSGSRAAFSELDHGVVGTVRFGDGSVVKIEGSGVVLFSCKNGEHRRLNAVYYIPRLDTNLISVGQLDEEGYDIHVKDGLMRIRDEQSRLLARVRRSPSRLYTLRLDIARPLCLTARKVDMAWLWHQRYGHISFQALKKLQSGDMVRGLPPVDHVDQLCDSCLAGKQRRSLFPAQARRRADGVLELVHGDIFGSITPSTPSGNCYFLLLVDDMSQYMWLCLLAGKDRASAAIRRFKAAAELESGCKLKVLRTDRGGSSPRWGSGNTAQRRAFSGSSRPRFRCNRVGSWSAGTRRW
jgi:hypothetical protein